jgi:hypothetical protein
MSRRPSQSQRGFSFGARVKTERDPIAAVNTSAASRENATAATSDS